MQQLSHRLDIYGQYPTGVPSPDNAVNVRVFTPDTTGSILLGFELDLNTGVLSLSFDEVVDPATFNPSGVTVLNVSNTSLYDVSESHVLIEAEPLIN